MTHPWQLEPPLSLDAIRRIDRICDGFEASLRSGTRTPLEPLLDNEDAPLQPQLMRALLAIELEYRRRSGERPAESEYLERFPHLADAVRFAFDDRAHDQSDVAGDAFSLFAGAFAPRPAQRADRLRIYHRGELRHTTTLEGVLELGRQRPGEAGPFARTQSVAGERLVMAPLEETTISRRHVLLAPSGADRVCVTNLSQVNPILLPNGRRLQSDQSDYFPLAVEMTLGTAFLRIDRLP